MGGEMLRRGAGRLRVASVVAAVGMLGLGMMGPGLVLAEPMPTETVSSPGELPTLPPVEPTATETTAVTPTSEVTPTETVEPTVTATPDGTGGVILVLTTVDGGNVPDTTRVCVEDTCQIVGDIVFGGGSARVPVGFSGLQPGDYNVWITHTAPYDERAGGIRIVADEVETIEVVLLLPTPTSVASVTSVPAVTATTPPTAAAAIASLPNTGVGGGSSSMLPVLLTLALGTVLAMTGIAWRNRRLS
ncbi:MAG: hypothetical protein QM753_15085 [Thermomicrobiales bacterium]